MWKNIGWKYFTSRNFQYRLSSIGSTAETALPSIMIGLDSEDPGPVY